MYIRSTWQSDQLFELVALGLTVAFIPDVGSMTTQCMLADKTLPGELRCASIPHRSPHIHNKINQLYFTKYRCF